MASTDRDVSDRALAAGTDADGVLERAFAALRTNHSSSPEPLREAIFAYVDGAKRRNEPPEQVVIGVKRIAYRAGVRATLATTRGSGTYVVPEALLLHAVTWCIERYYAAPEKPSLNSRYPRLPDQRLPLSSAPMSKPTPRFSDPAVLVTADDATCFGVWVESVANQRRWVFVSATTRDRYVGPGYGGEESLEQIRELVNEWWQLKKEIGQGVTAAKLRGWILNGR